MASNYEVYDHNLIKVELFKKSFVEANKPFPIY